MLAVTIVADVTSLQQPAGLLGANGTVASGGSRVFIPTIARSCVAAGVDGFMEVHNDRYHPRGRPHAMATPPFSELLAELKGNRSCIKGKSSAWYALRSVAFEHYLIESGNALWATARGR